MKINNNISYNDKFGDLKTGEMFITENISLYMKIEEINSIDDRKINAVNLMFGSLGYFDNEECVHLYPNANVNLN